MILESECAQILTPPLFKAFINLIYNEWIILVFTTYFNKYMLQKNLARNSCKSISFVNGQKY